MVSLQEFLNNTTWNPILDEHEEPTKKVLHLRIRVKADSTVDNLKVTLCGHDLRVDFENKSPNEPSIRTNAVKRSFCLSRWTRTRTSDSLADSWARQDPKWTSVWRISSHHSSDKDLNDLFSLRRETSMFRQSFNKKIKSVDFIAIRKAERMPIRFGGNLDSMIFFSGRSIAEKKKRQLVERTRSKGLDEKLVLSVPMSRQNDGFSLSVSLLVARFCVSRIQLDDRFLFSRSLKDESLVRLESKRFHRKATRTIDFVLLSLFFASFRLDSGRDR